MTKMAEIAALGQSCWLDDLTRDMIRNGDLRRWVEKDGLRGITSNPAIFKEAIAGSSTYDEDIEEGAAAGRSTSEIYERLTTTDVQGACDILRPVYDAAGGADGFVSLEVSPHLAHDAERSMEEARRLAATVDRPNLFIKIPGTVEGLKAIEELLVEGINVNITLLFSVPRYEAVLEAYLRALERRLEAGKPVDRLTSVASFFLSRIDVMVDQMLQERAETKGSSGTDPKTLLGRTAVANAKLAYEHLEKVLGSARWKALAQKGAKVQRLLWASTSTKNPDYNDLAYVEPLIGAHTVNTMPHKTIEALEDHGRVADTVAGGMDDAHRVMDALKELGIDIGAVADRLEAEGVQKFNDPFDKLMEALETKRRRAARAA